ncbi:MAG: Uma2 family endonuclease [Armatimonadetes bacterium]|nr:Uma2 family endonuclease [Armatimonadota bacterium]
MYGSPDLVIEIVSPNDRPSDLLPLEADYRSIGVSEIVFVDPQKKRVRHLRKNGVDYDESFLTTGSLRLVTVPGFVIEVEWLFDDNKPNPYETTQTMIAALNP